MARLLSWPSGLRPNRMRPLAGPRAVGASQSESISGFVQTTASPFGAVTLEFGFPDIRWQLARRVRGWIKALHGGANATRVPLCDWDGLSLAQRGLQGTSAQWKAGQQWSNGQPWSNGENWKGLSPIVSVAAAADVGATIISLSDTFWGHSLGMGDRIGFFPFHFGAYEITEVIEPGTYRIDFPLRKAITTDDFATLEPVLAMRLLGENAAQAERGAVFLQGLTIQLTEVFDYDVRDYFAD
jgi:hypothetical protein